MHKGVLSWQERLRYYKAHPTVVILRGPSGSGKSTFAKKVFPGAPVRSADDFFLQKADKRQEYAFDPAKLGEAHATCMGEVLADICAQRPVVVVDNTHTMLWEYYNYVVAAHLCHYAVEIYELMPCSLDELRGCCDRNIHGVPPEAVFRQFYRFEPDSHAVRVVGDDCGWLAAQQCAKELLGKSERDKDSALRDLANHNVTTHALVCACLDALGRRK
jgi:hypothetical protein